MKQHELFTTPIFVKDIGDNKLNSSLVDTVGVMMSNNPDSPVQKSNMGGWHSKETIFEPDRINSLNKYGQPLKTLGKRIDTFFHNAIDNVVEGASWSSTLDMYGWVTVLRDESWNSPHTHPNSSWSFIYYVETGEADKENGCIVFKDPRSSAIQHIKTPGEFTKPRYKIKPENGVIILFPSWLEHYVTPYYSDDLRIGISGNITMNNIGVDK